MAGALKKYLTALHLEAGDLLIFRPPLGAPDQDFIPFLEEVHKQTGRVVLVVRPGFSLAKLSDEDLAKAGLMRLVNPTLAVDGASLEELEHAGHQAIIRAFEEARNAAGTEGDPDQGAPAD